MLSLLYLHLKFLPRNFIQINIVRGFRQHCLAKTSMAKATVGTIRLNLLKLGARITISVRRILIAIASSCPYQDIWSEAYARIQALSDTG